MKGLRGSKNVLSLAIFLKFDISNFLKRTDKMKGIASLRS